MLLAVVLSLSQVASASPQGSVAPESTAPKAKLICVVEEEIGSRLSGKRVCRTKAEWDVIRQEARESVDSKLRNKVTGTPN